MSSLPAPQYFDRRTPPHVTTLVIMAGAGAMAMNIFLASLPEMARYYDRSYPVMQIALTGFLMPTSVCQLIIGPLSDRFGRRPVIIVALIIFILASIGAANSTVFEVFMFFRLVQAVIVAGMVISRASVRDMVAREREDGRLHLMMPKDQCIFGDTLFDYQVILSPDDFWFRDRIVDAETMIVTSTAGSFTYHKLDKVAD